jgi:hypothetical protein
MTGVRYLFMAFPLPRFVYLFDPDRIHTCTYSSQHETTLADRRSTYRRPPRSPNCSYEGPACLTRVSNHASVKLCPLAGNKKRPWCGRSKLVTHANIARPVHETWLERKMSICPFLIARNVQACANIPVTRAIGLINQAVIEDRIGWRFGD